MNQASFEAKPLSWHMLASRTKFPTLCPNQYAVATISAPGLGPVAFNYGGNNLWSAHEATNFLPAGSSWSGPLTLTAEIKVFDTSTTPSTQVDIKTITATVSPLSHLTISGVTSTATSISYTVTGGDSSAFKYQTVQRFMSGIGNVGDPVKNHSMLTNIGLGAMPTVTGLQSWSDFHITVTQEHTLNSGDTPIVTDSASADAATLFGW